MYDYTILKYIVEFGGRFVSEQIQSRQKHGQSCEYYERDGRSSFGLMSAVSLKNMFCLIKGENLFSADGFISDKTLWIAGDKTRPFYSDCTVVNIIQEIQYL